MSNESEPTAPASPPKILSTSELLEQAEVLLLSGCRKRSEVIDFLHTLTASLATATQPARLEAATLPVLGVQVDLTSTKKIFLGPDVNRYYTRTEAAALVALINRAMEGAS